MGASGFGPETLCLEVSIENEFATLPLTMPSARLILIAHAATAATRRTVFATGGEAPEASGLSAAATCGANLPAAAIALAAPALAARQTAEAMGLAATRDENLRDLDTGRWAGQPLSAIACEDLAAWLGDPAFAKHGGESLAALLGRVDRFLATWLAVFGTTVAVTHAAILRAALVTTIGAPSSAFWLVDAPPLVALTLGSDGRRWTLRGFGPLAEAIRASDG